MKKTTVLLLLLLAACPKKKEQARPDAAPGARAAAGAGAGAGAAPAAEADAAAAAAPVADPASSTTVYGAIGDAGLPLTVVRALPDQPNCTMTHTAQGTGVSVCEYASEADAVAGREAWIKAYAAKIPDHEILVAGKTTILIVPGSSEEAQQIIDLF